MRGKMTYADFYLMFAECCYLTKKDAKPVYERFRQKILERLDEDGEFIFPEIGKIKIANFGKHHVKEFNTGRDIYLPESKRILFKFDTCMKHRYKSKFKLKDCVIEEYKPEDKAEEKDK